MRHTTGGQNEVEGEAAREYRALVLNMINDLRGEIRKTETEMHEQCSRLRERLSTAENQLRTMENLKVPPGGKASITIAALAFGLSLVIALVGAAVWLYKTGAGNG